MRSPYILTTPILLVFLFASNYGVAQIINFPDVNFKNALLNNTVVIDTDGDGEIQVSEAAVYISYIGVYTDTNITDATGIEYFTNTNSIVIEGTNIQTISLGNLTSLNYFRCNGNKLTSIDISGCTNLKSFSPYGNLLTSLDISNNDSLYSLSIGGNQITNIDVTDKPNLGTLSLSGNPITSLDVTNNSNLGTLYISSTLIDSVNLSGNPNLTHFYSEYTTYDHLDLTNNPELFRVWLNFSDNLTTVDFSQNPKLEQLNARWSELVSVDVSNNPKLVYLALYYNYFLEELSLKNGRDWDSGYSLIQIHDTPLMTCIEVDNPTWHIANSTWPHYPYDYRTNCFYNTVPNTVTGSIFNDNDCFVNANESPISNVIVTAEPYGFYGVSDSLGNYSISTDSGEYVIQPQINHPLIYANCIDTIGVIFDTLAQLISQVDFHNETIECPYIEVDVDNSRQRRCFRNRITVDYCNTGFQDATGVDLFIHLPEYLNIINIDYPYSFSASNVLQFNIGNLAMGECGQINIIDSVSCVPDVVGLTQCVKAWVTPRNECYYELDSLLQLWDSSSVAVTGSCSADTTVQFTIKNIGTGDMNYLSSYRIFQDAQLVSTSNFQLLSSDSLNINLPANGQTYRVEADQHPNHTGTSNPEKTVEGCGFVPPSLGFVVQLPLDDIDPDVEIDCAEIVDSFDPNDKAVIPQGITEFHYVNTNVQLSYKIRFQNTGTDTAYKVVVKDVLSKHLDISTLEFGSSSHPYILDVSGTEYPVLTFTFNNINLLDSATSVLYSQGYLNYKIYPKKDLLEKTVVHNNAYIYFDFNEAIITNDAFISLFDTTITGEPLTVEETSSKDNTSWVSIYPNPANTQITIATNFEGNAVIFDMLGRQRIALVISSNNEINVSHLPNGIYFLQVGEETKKFVISR
ncbi:MAG: T9SS type A sorting domain-containing protein [Flavobacteriales bacterium]|nr:T9SS type A sorting domain-containing protein [Flavobacteriales bacterium]